MDSKPTSSYNKGGRLQWVRGLTCDKEDTFVGFLWYISEIHVIIVHYNAIMQYYFKNNHIKRVTKTGP